MALFGPLAPIEEVRFLTRSPSPDSVRLLGVAYDYLQSLPPQDLLAVCVCSSVAWGIATPASDLDIGLIVREGAVPCAEKRQFGSDFVDHCEWPFSWVADAVKDPLGNPILSYTAAFALVVYDPEGRLAAAQRQLVPRIFEGGGARKWIRHYLDAAAGMRIQARQALHGDPDANIASFLFEGVRRLADAVLHLLPGGHCGEWPHRLHQVARQWNEPWLAAEAGRILAPLGVDITTLASAIEPCERLHDLSATPPSGRSLGCSRESAAFFARKARYYEQQRDALSLLHVLRKQFGYVEQNLDAKRESDIHASELAGVTDELRRIRNMVSMAWPYGQDSREVSIELFDRYRERVAHLLDRRMPSEAAFQ